MFTSKSQIEKNIYFFRFFLIPKGTELACCSNRNGIASIKSNGDLTDGIF